MGLLYRRNRRNHFPTNLSEAIWNSLYSAFSNIVNNKNGWKTVFQKTSFFYKTLVAQIAHKYKLNFNRTYSKHFASAETQLLCQRWRRLTQTKTSNPLYACVRLCARLNSVILQNGFFFKSSPLLQYISAQSSIFE